MKHFSGFFAAFFSLLMLTGCSAASSAADADSDAGSSAAAVEKSLVTLGDSISAGYGLDDPSTERYSALLKEHLDSRDNVVWNDYNYAVSGDKSSDLIRKLNNGRALHAPSADTIILYIGANNLLGAYTDYLKEKAEENGIDLKNPDSISDEKIEELQTQLEAEMQDTDAVMKQIQSRIDQNLTGLESDLETIYQWIRERNPEADVYVLNIYNPYTPGMKSDMLPEDIDFEAYAQTQIDRANAVIKAMTDTHTDLIPVDIAAAFAACDPIPVIGITETDASEEDETELYDPHPTAEGQRIIADAVWKVMEEKQ